MAHYKNQLRTNLTTISPLPIPLRLPTPQMKWECPFCGSFFDEELTKDLHMSSCKRKSLDLRVVSKQQHYTATAGFPAQNLPKCPQPTKSEYPTILSIRLPQHDEDLSYISETNELYPLVWNSSKSQYTAHTNLTPGQHSGRIHLRTSNRYRIVKRFQVSPSTNSIEISIQDPLVDNATTRKPGNYLVKPTKQTLKPPPSQPSEPVKISYDDGQLYANVSKLADNFRLQHEVDQYKERVTELERENDKLLKDNANMIDIINSFHVKTRQLESEVTRLAVFESNVQITSNPSTYKPLPPPPISPRPDSYQTSVKQSKI